MASRKLWLSIAGLVIIVLVGIGFYRAKVFDAGLWALWFGAFDGIIIQYTAGNVVQKRVLKIDHDVA